MAKVRVFQRPDGTVSVVYPNPVTRGEGESENEWLVRTFARTIEADSSLDGLPYVDMDDSNLPARAAACADCDEEHSIRDHWRADRSGELSIETSARNLLADSRHLELAEMYELEQDVPDPSKIAAIDIARRKMRLHFDGKGTAPSEESVALAAAENLIRRRQR